MENRNNSLPEQEKTGLDKAKELFEYEMTEVLLNFKQEAASMKGTPSAEYLGMEVPAAGVEYQSPELEVEGIDYRETDAAVSIDSSALRTDLPPVAVAVPEAAAVELSTDVKIEVDESAFTAAEVPSMAEITVPAAQEPVLTGVDVPDVSLDADFAIPPAAEIAPSVSAEVPSVTAEYDLGAAPAVSAQTEIAEVKAVDLPPLSADLTPEIDVAVAEVKKPHIPEQTTLEAAVLPPIEIPDASAVSFTLDAPEAAAVPPEMPEIPAQPDFSADCAEITDLLRRELA